MIFILTWNSNWIDKYESIWSVLEKFKAANLITDNQFLDFFGNENIKKLKHVKYSGKSLRNLVDCSGLDIILINKKLGFDFNSQVEIILKVINFYSGCNHLSFFSNNLRFCSHCMINSYHSVFHQLLFFDTCVFHPNIKLKSKCENCKMNFQEYELLKDGFTDNYCKCVKNPENKYKSINTMFSLWKQKFELIENNLKTIMEKDYFNTKYNYYFPNRSRELIKLRYFMEDYIELNQLNSSFKKIEISVKTIHENIIEKKNYSWFYGRRHKAIMNYYFIYEFSKTIFKSIDRFIRDKYLIQHKNCIKNYHKLVGNKGYCILSTAYITWLQELKNTNISHFPHHKENYPFFNSNKEYYTLYPKGNYISKLEYTINSISNSLEEEKNFTEITSILYSVLKELLPYFLLERFHQRVNYFNYIFDNPNVQLKLDLPSGPDFYLLLFSSNKITLYKDSNTIKSKLFETHKNKCSFNKNKIYEDPFYRSMQVTAEKIEKYLEF